MDMVIKELATIVVWSGINQQSAGQFMGWKERRNQRRSQKRRSNVRLRSGGFGGLDGIKFKLFNIWLCYMFWRGISIHQIINRRSHRNDRILR